MRSTRTIWIVLFAICLAAIALWIGERIAGAPRLRQADVGALATAYIGQPEARVAKPICLLLTDRSNPVMKLKARPVWETVVDGVDISAQFPGQPKFENKNIHRFTVLFDRQTGALLKIFSPKPKTGGLSIISEHDLNDQGVSIRPTIIRPKLSLLQAFKASMPENLFEGIMQAKEIVAYYGLGSDNFNPKTGMKDVPCWVVLVGGIHQPAPGGRWPGRTLYADEAYVVINAVTGKAYASEMTGPP